MPVNMLPVLAHAVGPVAGVTDPSWLRFFMHRSVLDLVLLLPVILAALYARGLRGWPKEQRTLKRLAPLSFYSGVALIFFALAPPMDELVEELFFVHMIQHMVLVMIGTPLILLGSPTTPVLKGLPKWGRRGVVAPLMRSKTVHKIWRFLSHPASVFVIFSGTLWTWHFYHDAYVLAAQNVWVHLLEHWSMVFAAILFWWVIIDPKPLKSRLPYPLRVFFIFITMLQQVLIGAFITYRGNILYPYYAERARIWNVLPVDDQQLAAMFMWIGGTSVFMTAVIVTVGIWLSRDERITKARELAEARALE